MKYMPLISNLYGAIQGGDSQGTTGHALLSSHYFQVSKYRQTDCPPYCELTVNTSMVHGELKVVPSQDRL